MASAQAASTRQHILQQAAVLFNQQGYAGTSLSDVMAATGLKKGGIYNHFKGKEDLALQSFDYTMAQVRRQFYRDLKGQKSALAQLQVFMSVFERAVTDPLIPGGCPILNTAVTSADTHPELRSRARKALEQLRQWACLVIQRGMDEGELREDVDPNAVATLVISTLEGAVMMSRLYEDEQHMLQVKGYLLGYLAGLARLAKPRSEGPP